VTRTLTWLAALALFGAGACTSSHVAEPDAASARPVAATSPAPATSTAAVTLSPKLSRPAPERLVAIGDLHGDLDHARRALRLAGAIDEHDRWIGGHTVLVQTGDAIDRGDDDRAHLDLEDALKKEASAAGGEFIALLGNHEIMNASLDFRYVTPGGYATFGGDKTGRAAAFAPGGAYALVESHRPVMIKVGDSVFVHGGILPKHVAYGLDKMNDEIDAWLEKKDPAPPAVVVAEDGPVWTRVYSNEGAPADCETLRAALAELGAKRMVVGHTVQKEGINPACNGAVYRIDVGLSRFFGGPIQVLEIRGDKIEILREKP
jgi:hypothetical protein